MSNAFQYFLQTKDIISQRSCPSMPQQNGVAERKNHHLLDMVKTLLIESFVPFHFWCEALSTIVHLINRLPSTTLDSSSPFYKLFGCHPTYSHLCPLTVFVLSIYHHIKGQNSHLNFSSVLF